MAICRTFLTLLFPLIFLSACGGGGGSGSDSSPSTPITNFESFDVQAAAVKGPLANARVDLYAMDTTQPDLKGELITSSRTGGQANVTGLEISEPLADAYILEFVSEESTIDLNTGQPPVLSRLRTWINAEQIRQRQKVYATPVSTLAGDMAALMSADGASPEDHYAVFSDALKIISTEFGFGQTLDDGIVTLSPMLTEGVVSQTLVRRQIVYRAVSEALVAVLGNLKEYGDVSFDEMLRAIAQDLSDETLDGMNFDVQVSEFENIPNLVTLLDGLAIGQLEIPNTNNQGSAFTVSDIEQLMIEELSQIGVNANTALLNEGAVNVILVPRGSDFDNDGIPDLTDADDDNDKVIDSEDAFPLDAAEYQDTDNDGAGDNADVYDNDASCFLESDGNGNECYLTWLATQKLDFLEVSSNGVIHFLGSDNNRIFRFDTATRHFISPLELDSSFGPVIKVAYSPSHQRLYLAHSNGQITYFSDQGGSQQSFASTPRTAGGLASVGDYLLAQDPSGAWNTHYIFDDQGNLTDSEEWNRYSRTYTWSPADSRVYFFRDGSSPNDLHYEVIDQTTGEITAEGETPHHGDYSMTPPIRVSANGQYVLLGSGDVYDSRANLAWSGSIGRQFDDAIWLADGGLITVATKSDGVFLERFDADLTLVEQLSFDGSVLALTQTDNGIYLLVLEQEKIVVHLFTPNNDSDGDGVSNWEDAFPLDVAASLDSDRDGYPDSWNEGYSANDSTTGLLLDAYPQDTACYLPEHGDGTACDYTATMPAFLPNVVLADSTGDIYLLSSDNYRIYRWSTSESAYIDPIVVGIDQGFSVLAPSKMAYSQAHNRLYLGYSSGTIQYVDLDGDLSEQAFANTAQAVGGLASVGNFVLAQDASGAWNTHYIFDEQGNLTDSQEWNRNSRTYTWSPTDSRVYFFRDGTSPNDLHYEVIDQVTGEITAEGETPHHGDYSIIPPIRVTANGQYVLLGSGDIYDSSANLAWSGSIGRQFEDAIWLADGGLVTVTTGSDGVFLERFSAGLEIIEQLNFNNNIAVLALAQTDNGIHLVTLEKEGIVVHLYTPNDDTDGDGISNLDDAFPLDAAASLDSDHDGYPDSWNNGYGAGDSTTGLTLDAYPEDSACYLPEHGDGTACDYAATMPIFEPDTALADSAGNIYLLSSDNYRVYRWSTLESAYINPIVVGIDQGFSTLAPSTMAYSESHNRLYFGYSSGAIQYVDLNGDLSEQAFANTAQGVSGLASVGRYLLAQNGRGSRNTRYIFDEQGNIADSEDWNHNSGTYTWSPTDSRVYFFRDGSSPNDLHYQVIDQATGEISGKGETPHHGDYSIIPPIRVTANGQYVLLGSGDIYDSSANLTWSGSIGRQFDDAIWLADGGLISVTTVSDGVFLERFNADLAIVEQLNFDGSVVALTQSDNGIHLVTLEQEEIVVHLYTPNEDTDGDGVNNVEDAFPLDVAASLDSDHDGYPDSWNNGYGAGDSTTGLALDAYPEDTACYLPEHGDGNTCDYAATMPTFVPDAVITDNAGHIYLLSSDNYRVYRWSTLESAYVNPIVVGIDQGFSTLAPSKIAYSEAHNRLYLGYSSGAIQYVDLDGDLSEQAFANTAQAVGGLTSVGNFVLAQDASGAWNTHYIFDEYGNLTDSEEWNYFSRSYAWNEGNSRVYFFRDVTSPNDLHYEEIDQVSGEIIAEGETPYHGIYPMRGPINISADNAQILIGNGNIFNASDMTWAATLGINLLDAIWFDEVLVTLEDSATTNVSLWDPDSLQVINSFQFASDPVALIADGDNVILLHETDEGLVFADILIGDQDSDGMPAWWENLHGLNDDDNSDSTLDGDADGLDNLEEYLAGSDPHNDDSDGDNLNDGEEVRTYLTSPILSDTDDDDLNDYDEINTYLTNPNDMDSDNDSFSDGDEVLRYNSDPNNASSIPSAIASYFESFEASEIPALWQVIDSDNADWYLETTNGYDGSQSIRSGEIDANEHSAIKFAHIFNEGTLSFYARVDSQSCCDRLYVYLDGTVVLNTTTNTWRLFSVDLSEGLHILEWRYQKDGYGSRGSDAAWIDNISFDAN